MRSERAVLLITVAALSIGLGCESKPTLAADNNPSPSVGVPDSDLRGPLYNPGNATSPAPRGVKPKVRSSGEDLAAPLEATMGLTDRSAKTGLGLTDRAAKTSVGLTDRAAKTSVGLTDRAAKTSIGLADRAVKTSVGLPRSAVKGVIKVIFWKR